MKTMLTLAVLVAATFTAHADVGLFSPNVRLYEGAWKEYVWLKGKSLPAETGGVAAGK